MEPSCRCYSIISSLFPTRALCGGNHAHCQIILLVIFRSIITIDLFPKGRASFFFGKLGIPRFAVFEFSLVGNSGFHSFFPIILTILVGPEGTGAFGEFWIPFVQKPVFCVTMISCEHS